MVYHNMRRRMDYIQKINELKRRKNVVILTHCYQPVELDEVSDFVGDSFYLSKKATTTNADIIVFAGVYFMAQSAKLLNPDKKVLLPNMNSGCFMSDMIGLSQENLEQNILVFLLYAILILQLKSRQNAIFAVQVQMR